MKTTNIISTLLKVLLTTSDKDDKTEITNIINRLTGKNNKYKKSSNPLESLIMDLDKLRHLDQLLKLRKNLFYHQVMARELIILSPEG
jgi:hypothetical protein